MSPEKLIDTWKQDKQELFIEFSDGNNMMGTLIGSDDRRERWVLRAPGSGEEVLVFTQTVKSARPSLRSAEKWGESLAAAGESRRG